MTRVGKKSVIRGVPPPPTVTRSLNSTVSRIRSPATKTPSGPVPVPESATPVTVGATASTAEPFTVNPLSFATAWVPRPSAAALPAASRIVPPFSPSAVRAAPTPFVSVSPATTA